MYFRPKAKVWFSPKCLDGRTFSAATIKEMVRQKKIRLGEEDEGKKRQKPLTPEEMDLLDGLDLDELLHLQEANEGLTSEYRNTLGIPIEHGDILVMYGPDIHRYFEVCMVYLRTKNCSTNGTCSTKSVPRATVDSL